METSEREQWFPGLSSEMNRAVEMIIEYGKLVRYMGGFWHKESANLLPLRNGGNIVGYYPEGYIITKTINALITRKILVVTKYEEGYNGKYPTSYPVECELVKLSSKI